MPPKVWVIPKGEREFVVQCSSCGKVDTVSNQSTAYGIVIGHREKHDKK